MDFFPFHALGFHCNPFRALTREEWIATTVLPEDLQTVSDRGFTHLQILGDKGAGKTTRLLALQSSLDARGQRTAYEYLPEGQNYFVTRTAELDYFILDEVQRLNSRQRRRLAGFAGAQPALGRFFTRSKPSTPGLRLILGSHEDLTPYFARLGLPLQTLSIQNSASHLNQVVQRRLAYFSLGENPPIVLDELAVEWLYDHFNGDYRAVLDCLYEIFQQAVDPKNPKGLPLKPFEFGDNLSRTLTLQQVQAAIALRAAQG